MKYAPFLLSLVIVHSLFAQTDTLYYDPLSGNYIVRYIGVTMNGEDTLITFSYEPPTKIDPIIRAFVTSTSNGKYLYRYRIANGPQAQQNLNEFSLHLGKGVSVESRTPLTSWDNRRPKNFLPDTGFADRWVWRGHQGLEATWYIDSCIVASDGLPSITESYSQAKRRIQVWPADQKDNSQIDIDRELGRLEAYPNANVLRMTVGPKLPPSPFDAISFVDTLLSYTRQSVTLGWLRSTRDNDCDLDEKPEDGVANNFEKRLTKVRTELTDGDTIKASKELEKFIKKVERVSKRNEVMTSEAYALLKYNAEYLVGRIITLPARSTGTLLQQIDELKAEVQNQQSKKNLGGLLLVKGLTTLLDVAKQRLQQTDSMQTAIAIGLFQLTVDETNKLTDALLEKNKPLPPLYVKDEAYVQLHYRAKYILEALPELRIDLQQQRQQMMEKELRQELDSLKQKMEQ